MLNKKNLEKEIEELEVMSKRVIAELNNLRKRIPANVTLIGGKHRNSFQYYYNITGSSQRRRYIKKKDIATARALAQIEYNEKLLEEINKRRQKLEEMAVLTEDNMYIRVLGKMNESKRVLVNVPYVSDEDYILNWLQQDFEKLCFKENTPELYTRKGMRARSKTEVLIADMLEEMEIPFIYEKPLELKSGTVHPDFTLLDMRNRKEVYWEHFGMMDDVEYRNNAFLKIRKYEESGLFQHDSLIWTFETSKYQISTKFLRKMITGLREAFCTAQI